MQLLYVLVDQEAEIIKAGLSAYVISSVSVPKSSIISPKQHPQMRNKGSNTDLPTTLLSCNSENSEKQEALSPAYCRHTTKERELHLHIL